MAQCRYLQTLLTWQARRSAMIVGMLIAAALPSSGQQLAARQEPAAIAAKLNLHRSELYQKQDTEGVAALYTSDAEYVELMPVLHVFEGRDAIKGHLEELIGADAVGIVPVVTAAARRPDGTITVQGDYRVISDERDLASGHFVQFLREVDGTWRIALHVFARPERITAKERDGRD